MADIFISYASEDRARVRPLAEALQSRGFNIWWDRSLAAGQDYTAIIERELKNAKAVIVVWTQSSALSTFVRDEAGRARDEGRLVPVLLDKVDIPLGFGAFQAEDFTKWNGGANAPQMQLLEEVLKSKLSGREVDSAAIQRRRSRLGARIRLVSVLTVIALVIGIAAGGRYLFNPPDNEVTQADLRAELLRLLAEGQLTPEQAIQLAELLEAGALGEQQANLRTEDGVSPAPSASEPMGAESASITEAEFDATARQTYRQAFLAVSQHPDAQVRLAAAQMAQPSARAAAMQTLWQYAQSNPDDPLVDEIYLLCGSVGESNADPLGQRALEAATNLSPRDANVWRMLSRSYRRTNDTNAAEGAALVSDAVTQQNAGQTAEAEATLQQALPNLEEPQLRASVVSELGAISESRQDFTSASARYAEAYRLREQGAEQAPGAEVALEADAQQLVRALDRSGRTREACQRLRQAQEDHDVAAPDAELLQRCEREHRVQLRDEVRMAPTLRQRAIVPAPAPAQTP